MAPPVYERYHGTPHSALVTWASIYAASSPGTVPADNTSLRLLADDELQPDVYLRIMETCGGRTHADRDGYIVGGPEFIAEVAATTASYDLHDKFQAYLRNGVQEYLVWRTYDREIDWFVLRGDRYDRLPPGSDGIYRSEIFPGLWLDTRALLAGDLLRVLQVLQQGLAAPEHERFVARLKNAASQQKG